MICDADIHKNLCADIVSSGGGNVSFESVTTCYANTPENLYAVVPWTMMGSSLAVSVLTQLTLDVTPSINDCWMRHLPRITVRGGTLVLGGVSLQTLDTCSPQDLQQEWTVR